MKKMIDLRRMLFEKERIGKVLEIIREDSIPDPQAEPERALLYGHALVLYGDLGQARRLYSAIPSTSPYEAERLLGLAITLLRIGDLGQAKRLLDEALNKCPTDWLAARIYNAWVGIYDNEGNFVEGYRAIEKGIAATEREPQPVMRLVLEGNRGAMQGQQDFCEESILCLQRVVKQLQARGAVHSTGHFLINLGIAFDNQGDYTEAERCFNRAEKFVRESGCVSRLIYLRITQGGFWERMNRLDKAERAYEECRELLRELPIPEFEIILNIHRANLSYIKGNIAEALRIIRNVQMLIRDKGLSLYEDKVFFNEGRFLVRSGAVREGLEILDRAAVLAKERNRLGLLSAIALFQAYGYEELNQRDKTLERMTRCLAAVEASHSFQDALSHRDVLAPLLLHLGDRLPFTDTLSTFVVELRHPVLVKRLLRRSPEGKSYFLRSLKVHDARHFRSYLVTLRNDPEKQVRQASRLILQNWQHYIGYRIYTLGTFRVFLEGKPFIEKDWGRAGIKRLFLFFMTCPEEWQNTEVLLETLWQKSSSYPRSPEALRPLFSNLRSLFEPWHMPDMEYVFFQSRRGAYGFFPGKRFWIDAREFDEKVKQAEKAHRDRRFKEARKAYREAFDLYVGDYLEEFPYEDWLKPKRDYLRELYFRSSLRYATLEQESGNLPEARRVLEEALFKDMSRSGFVVPLVEVLSRMGLREETKAWGERHVSYLKKELGLNPTPEVIEALKQIK